jgi:hypothetical protein
MEALSLTKKEKIILVGVIKNRRDLKILLKENWYRIPLRYAPKRGFHYLAFYQPLFFGRQGKCIRYYARVLNRRVVKRGDLLLDEPEHPRAGDYYLRVRVGKIKKLPQPIRNIIPRRISFGFTTLNHFLKSKDILQLYKVAPLEPTVEDGLKKAGIRVISQYHVNPVRKGFSNRMKGDGKRYFLDFAIFCQKGKIAIECDTKKVHSLPSQKERDKIKDNFLRSYGWKVIRLKEDEIMSNLSGCIERIKKAVQKLGGLR